MSKKVLCLALCAMLFALSYSASAQQPKKVPRIGYLSPVDPAGESTRAEAIRQALGERGYIEGQNIAIEHRYTEGKRDRFSELAAELVRLEVDILVVGGADPGIRAAKNATKTIPIVMMGVVLLVPLLLLATIRIRTRIEVGGRMQKKLTITLDERVYDGLHRVVGRRRISRFLESLARPHVIGRDLEAAYRQMAKEEAREAEALEWAEATVGNVANETR
jgi:hypothetical protein